MPFTEPSLAQRAAHLMSARSGSGGVIACVFDEKRDGFINVVNHVFALSSAEWVAYVAQDAYPGRLWLNSAMACLQTTSAGLLAFNDGKWHGQLASFGLVARAWALQNYGGPLFNPAYHSHFADAELTLLALNDGKYTYDPDAVLVEVDWEKDQKKVNADDRALFQRRAASGFDDRITNPTLMSMFA